VLLEQPGQRRAGQRMVVDEEDSLCHSFNTYRRAAVCRQD
jgi:hypothetical protein